MMTLFLVICCATVLLGLGMGILLVGSHLLGRPLSKGCQKPDCCQKKTCDKTEHCATKSRENSTSKCSSNDDVPPTAP
ncbi:hypothetical protein ACH8ZP_02530 [Chlamydia pneumoniae]|uniref:Uncharacterized protein n=2 Tax=Chlamydia pneumoniae TaxID=83558 RepID=Q9K2B5_CHLPN|nr:hypothetical protein [Chlamydia pneumoniae]AAF38106.1 hypothetical protein CP_0241 [Chlamydia pneumoniae AR39]